MATKGFYTGDTASFVSTKTGEKIVGMLEKRHVSRGIHVWWEVSTTDGGNWRVPERMLSHTKVPKAKLEKGVKAARQRKEDLAEFKAERKARRAGKLNDRGVFERLRVGMYVLYRGQRRRIVKLMPESGKVSLELYTDPMTAMWKCELGLRVKRSSAVRADWVHPCE